MNITIDPKTGMLQAQHTTADGKNENYDIKPEEIPGLIQQAQDASGYWKQVFRLSDPASARAKEQQEYDTDKLKEGRTYEESQTKEKRSYDEEQNLGEEERAEKRKREEEERAGAAKLEEEKRTGASKLEEEKRKNEQAEKMKLLEAGIKDAGGIDREALAPVLDAANKARDTKDTDPAVRNETASRLYDIIQDPAKMASYGFPMESFTYVAKAGGSGVTEANIVGADGKPLAAKGQPQQDKNGKWWVLGPNGKYIPLTKVDEPAAAP